MNYSFQVPSPYMHPAMAQAIQAFMSGGPLPPNCFIVAIPFHQAQHILPQLMMSTALFSGDQMMYHQQSSYYGPSPYTSNPQQLALEHQQNYNYPIVPYKQSKKKTSHPKQHHSNIYNSTSFDSYMEKLSWSRLFDRPSRKTAQQKTSKKSGSHSSSSSTVSDETIRRVNVANNQPTTNTNSKQEQQQTKGSLPFKYSSEFVPGINKQQEKSQKIKSNDVFIVKKS